jgi:prepilin-type N-terminal cleavage/methylation domain-containing protein
LTLSARSAILELMQCIACVRRAGARHQSRRDGAGRDSGFTLVEILVVMVLIGVLLLVGLPNLIRAKVRAEMLGQVKMARQAFAVSRINAIKAGQQVGVTIETVGAARALVAWVDADADQVHDNNERLVGRWTFRNAFNVYEDDGNKFFRLNGSNPGVLYLPTGAAIVENGATTPVGDAAMLIGDINGNVIRLQVLGGTGSLIEEMRVPGTDDWDRNTRHWRY